MNPDRPNGGRVLVFLGATPDTRSMNPSTPLLSRRVKIHDGIIGALLIATTALSVYVDPRFFWLAALTGAIMLSSAFTGFCPVHYAVRKALPDAE